MTDKLTVNVLASLVLYDVSTGMLFWKHRNSDLFPDKRIANTWNSRFAGKLAFSQIQTSGHFGGRILGVNYKAHRVAWAIHYGEWPKTNIDHINCIITDNRIANLREASKSENGRNRGKNRANTTGYKGVCFDRWAGKYRACVGLDNKRVYAGRFDTKEEAYAAYCEAAKKHHGPFVNLG